MADPTELLNLIRQAVQERVTEDCGAVLSGGLDSSTVVSLLPAAVPTFTGYYADGPEYDERHWARLVAGPLHHEILITPQDFIDNFDQMVPHLREPFQGMGTFGQYMVGKYIAENTGCKTILSGEGSDELFGGYARLHIVAGEAPPEGYENYKVPADYPRTLQAALDYDYQRLPDLLAVDDQCMAAHGLKAVAPFTDERIVDYALALPPALRVKKRHLKDAVRGVVPDEIIDRRDKRGFPIPLVQWANGPLRDFIGDRLGYLPDPAQPWDRGWWYDLLAGGRVEAAA